MWFKYVFISLSTLIFISESAFSQNVPAKKDTIHTYENTESYSRKADTTHIYQNIETYSKHSKFTKFLYGLIFKPHKKKPKYKKPIQKSYNHFEGKIIRHIKIVTLDPFGYSIEDTTSIPQNALSKAGDMLHIKSQTLTIRNLLLIHQNQEFDSLLVRESERLVRSGDFVKDVSFFVRSTSGKSDSVDIFIRELDTWSLIPNVLISTSRNTVNFTDENFIGLGHHFKNDFTRDINKGIYAYSTDYMIPNIRNTYINASLHYEVDGYKNFRRSFAIERPFYSPLTKWAAGVAFKDSNSVLVPLHYNLTTQDYWIGHAQQIFKGNTLDERTTKLITTARYLRVRYLEMPSELYDSLHYYSNEDFYLAGIGISTRKYVEDKYVYKFGLTEDVPVGKVFALTGGYQVKNNSGRLFLGGRFSIGDYYPWGYFSSDLEYETFFRSSKTEEGLFTAKVIYFTNLFEIGKWKFRQFVKPQITIGINRFSYDSLTLNYGFGNNGFKSTMLSGSRRLLLSLQTQAYAPWNFIGFRFGPYFTYSLGMLGNAETGFKNNKIYSNIGLGVLIKNVHLVLNTFQVSISFYPIIPGKGQNIFEMNSLQTTDFGFSDFDIGKPTPIVFQ
jgi:hypothetical protein